MANVQVAVDANGSLVAEQGSGDPVEGKSI